jgi:hypothetical protein
MIYQSNTTGATNGEGTAYPSGTPMFALVFSGIRVVDVVKLHVFMFLASYIVMSICFVWGSRFIYVIYI